jgi:hypothetical protein
MYGMTGIAMTGGSLVSLFLPMEYEGTTRGSTIASKTAAILTVILAASSYYLFAVLVGNHDIDRSLARLIPDRPVSARPP